MKENKESNSILSNLNKVPAKYWNEICIISYLQRVILIHSFLYYENSTNIISDKSYDEISRYLQRLQIDVSETKLKKTYYYKAFKDFDGNTGFDLLSRITEDQRERIKIIANQIIKQRG